MLSDEEKNRLLEKVKFEDEIRKTLSPSDAPKQTLIGLIWEKASSSLGLLLIGAVVTGLLVPMFQANQKKLEWERQIRYENVKFNLAMKRDCLKELMLAGTFLSEAYELIEPYKNDQPINDKDFEQLYSKLFEIQNNRFKQNAKVVAMLVYFSDYETASKLFKDYTSATNMYLNNGVKSFLILKHSLPVKPNKIPAGDLKEVNDLNNYIDEISDLTQKFNLVLNYMLSDIKTKEDEYVKAIF